MLGRTYSEESLRSFKKLNLMYWVSLIKRGYESNCEYKCVLICHNLKI